MPSVRPQPSAKLSQERSRATRKAIVGAALRLWTERGFDAGFESTTMDQIGERAGVSRATV